MQNREVQIGKFLCRSKDTDGSKISQARDTGRIGNGRIAFASRIPRSEVEEIPRLKDLRSPGACANLVKRNRVNRRASFKRRNRETQGLHH